MRHKLPYSLFLLFNLAVAGNGLAQEEQIAAEYFGQDKGLNITYLLDIFQDRTGFLWLATREGLIRFDGHNFRYFRNEPGDTNSIMGNPVSCVTEDTDGNIWAGLIRGGVSRYDRKTGKFRNYRFTEKLKIKTATVSRIFFDREGEIWLGISGYGMVHLDARTGDMQPYDLVTAQTAPHLTPEEIPLYNFVQNFWQDENGLLWCATSDDLYSFDPKTGIARPHRFDKVAYTGFRQNQAYALLPENEWLWVGGWGSGLRKFNRKTGEWKQFLLEENASAPDAVNVVNSIAPKGKDELWVTSGDKGLIIFNKKTEKFHSFHQEPGANPALPVSSANNLTFDHQGNIWINHASQLLRIQIKDQQFRFNSVPSDRPLTKELSVILDILDDREDQFRFIAFPAGDGLQIRDKKSGKSFVPRLVDQPGVKEYNRLIMDLMQARDGTIWVLGRHILYRFNPQTLQLDVPPQPPVFSPEIGSNYYTQLTEDDQGHIWMGTSLYGVFRYNPQTGESTHFMPDENKPGSIATNVVGSVAADATGRIWYGSRDKTAYGYFRQDQNQFVYLDAAGQPTKALATLRMNSFFTDHHGDIWACTEQGLLHFDCSAAQPRLRKKYTMEHGLPSDYIAWGQEDNKGNIWLVAANQLCRLKVPSDQISVLGKRDGLPVTSTGIGKLNNGQLFLKAGYGYYTFDPDSLNPRQKDVPVVLTSFKVNDQEKYAGSERVLSHALVVPSEGRFFSMEFAALDFSSPESSRYEYRLAGFDDRWTQAGNRHYVNYTNIPSGQYTFQAKLEGMPDEKALSIPLKVRVSFYRTNWFRLLIMGILTLGILSYFRYRQQQRRHVEVLKNKAHLLEKEKALVQYESLKQQLNPHFLFNSLTSLSSLITIDPKAATQFLDRLSKTYRYILKSSERETVPLSEELKFGESFIELQKTRFGEGLQVHFRVAEEYLHQKIVPVTLQNLLENAIKHNIIDEDSPLVVDIFVEKGYLVVRNNLQKKKFVETSNKRGLANLQSFYRYLSDKPVKVTEDQAHFTIRIPVL